MTRMNLLTGFLLAFCLAAAGSVGFALLTTVFAAPAVLKIVFATTALTYSLVLLHRTGDRTGLVTFTAAWVIVTVCVVAASNSDYVFVVSQALLIWLCRCFQEKESLFCALLDLMLTAVAVLAGIWAALMTGSIFLTLWSFFLVQAMHVFIPASLAQKTPPDRTPFDKAHHVAEQALRQLSSR